MLLKISTFVAIFLLFAQVSFGKVKKQNSQSKSVVIEAPTSDELFEQITRKDLIFPIHVKEGTPLAILNNLYERHVRKVKEILEDTVELIPEDAMGFKVLSGIRNAASAVIEKLDDFRKQALRERMNAMRERQQAMRERQQSMRERRPSFDRSFSRSRSNDGSKRQSTRTRSTSA